MIKFELRKLFGSRWFYVAVGIGCALAVWSALEAWHIDVSADAAELSYGHGINLEAAYHSGFSNKSCFSNWMLVNTNATLGATIFFYLAPLLAAIPFAWSLASEQITGYYAQGCVRSGRGRAMVSKAIAVFISGGLTILIPLLVNFVIVACIFPAYMPEYVDSQYIGVFEPAQWSYLFYNAPAAYVAAFCIWDFLLCGAWAVFALSISTISRNRVIILVFPYLLALGWTYLNRYLFTAILSVVGPGANLIDALQAITGLFTDVPIFMAEAVFLFGASLVFLHRDAWRDLL